MTLFHDLKITTSTCRRLCPLEKDAGPADDAGFDVTEADDGAHAGDVAAFP